MTAPPAGALESDVTPEVLLVCCEQWRSFAHATKDSGLMVAALCSAEMMERAAKEIARLKRENIAALRLREWRPIAEAPKDGTRVLLWIKWSDEPVVGEFSHGRWWAGTEHHEVSCGAYCYGGSVTSDKSMEPILWRPIEPPTADDLARILEEGE